MVVMAGEGRRIDRVEKSLFLLECTFFPFRSVEGWFAFGGTETKNKSKLTTIVFAFTDDVISFSDITANALLNAMALTGLTCC